MALTQLLGQSLRTHLLFLATHVIQTLVIGSRLELSLPRLLQAVIRNKSILSK